MAAHLAVIPETGPSQTIKPGEHVIFRSKGAPDYGPTLIVFGSLHGNEAAGAHALLRVSEKLASIKPRFRGRVVFLVGNTRAIAEGKRYIDADLNRHWTHKNIDDNRKGNIGELSEDIEQSELFSILIELLETALDEVYVLDLHSTSAAGVPFATVGDTMRNRHFAMQLPVTILLGIEEQLDGTLLEYLSGLGTVTLGFEGGEHYAESTVDTHEALIWLALMNSGLLAEDDVPDPSKHRNTLQNATGKPQIIEVRYRHAISPDQQFEMKRGFQNFDPVQKDQILANDLNGAIYAKESGMILMPLYQKLGDDGFFVGRAVAPFWIRLSGIVRRLRLANLMPLLPGVRRSLTDINTLEINTAIARFFPLQIFHLLGFRKLRWENDLLRVTRRRFDTVSPFRRRQG